MREKRVERNKGSGAIAFGTIFAHLLTGTVQQPFWHPLAAFDPKPMAKPPAAPPKRRRPPAASDASATTTAGKVKASDIQGLKYFQILAPLLAGLQYH